MTHETTHPKPNYPVWTCSSTQSLGTALLRLETARELALVRLQRADPTTHARWTAQERKVERFLDECERLLAVLGEGAVPAAAAGIRSLELEVCEFIGAPPVHH